MAADSRSTAEAGSRLGELTANPPPGPHSEAIQWGIAPMWGPEALATNPPFTAMDCMHST